MKWAEKTPALDCDEAFVPSLSERISFATLQPVSATGSTQSELQKLSAMESKDTLQRLEKSIKLVKNNISVVAAKLALQSI